MNAVGFYPAVMILIQIFGALGLSRFESHLGQGPCLGVRALACRAAHPSGRVVVLPFQNQLAMPRLYALADPVALPISGPG